MLHVFPYGHSTLNQAKAFALMNLIRLDSLDFSVFKKQIQRNSLSRVAVNSYLSKVKLTLANE